jgi:hypothetical protein
MQKTLLVLCLVFMTLLLGYNLYLRILREKFVDKVDNNHNCHPDSAVHRPYNSYMSPAKGWCTSNSYGPAPFGGEHDDEIYNRSPIKCPANYKRISAKESVESESKSFCKQPDPY